MSKPRIYFFGAAAMCGVLMILVVLSHTPNDSGTASEVVLSVPIVAENTSTDRITIEKEFECPDEGTYWVQIRYRHSLHEIDARMAPRERKTGVAVMTALETKPKIALDDSESKSVLPFKEIKWKPTEASTKASQYAADLFELKLKSNTRYKLQFILDKPDNAWIALDPVLVIEPSHALRNSRAFRKICLWPLSVK
jgi:hypothetical protein